MKEIDLFHNLLQPFF